VYLRQEEEMLRPFNAFIITAALGVALLLPAPGVQGFWATPSTIKVPARISCTLRQAVSTPGGPIVLSSPKVK